ETGDPAPKGWREVEFELTGGDGALLQAADKFLLRGGLGRPGQSAQFARGVGVGAPDPPAGRKTRAGATGSRHAGGGSQARPAGAGDVITAYLAEQVATMKALDPAVRGDEPDAVHQMRIAVRRLRATLRTFGGIIWPRQDGQAVDQLASDLKWLGTVLGGPRDA